jgi:predicted dehydrogenase
MLKAAMIGLGWWGQELVRASRDCRRLRFVRAVTLEPDLARDFVAEHGLVLGASYEEALADPDIGAVVLATPHTRHRAQVEAAAAAGKHVFCEKPFALTRADAEVAIAACRKAGVALGVGHNRRLWPSIVKLKELIDGGTLGTIMHAEGNYSHDWLANQPADHWRSAAAETKAGGMTGMGIHLLDCFRLLVGPMRRLAALSTKRVLPLESGDTTSALIEFADGATGAIATTLKTPYVWRLAVYGSDAWAESVSETRVVMRKAGAEEVETIDCPPVNHIALNLDSFAGAALGQGRFLIDDSDIVGTVAALEAVFESAAADGAWRQV